MYIIFQENIYESPNSKNPRILLGILLASVSSAFAQMQVIDPVGMIKLNVAGTGGAASYYQSLLGLGLTLEVAFQSRAETISINTLTDNEAAWSNNQFNGANGAHYLEILSGPGTGTTYDIVGTSATTKQLTLVQNLAAGITAPVTFNVRKHRTIANVFGPNNEGGLAGGSLALADQISIYNPGVGYNTYYYQTSGSGGVGLCTRGRCGQYNHISRGRTHDCA